MAAPTSRRHLNHVTGDEDSPPTYVPWGVMAMLVGGLLLWQSDSRFGLALGALVLLAGLALVTAGLVINALWTDSNTDTRRRDR